MDSNCLLFQVSLPLSQGTKRNTLWSNCPWTPPPPMHATIVPQRMLGGGWIFAAGLSTASRNLTWTGLPLRGPQGSKLCPPPFLSGQMADFKPPSHNLHILVAANSVWLQLFWESWTWLNPFQIPVMLSKLYNKEVYNKATCFLLTTYTIWICFQTDSNCHGKRWHSYNDIEIPILILISSIYLNQ